ncbi:MAG: hypothetical protein AB7U74_08125 [Afipia sp.]
MDAKNSIGAIVVVGLAILCCAESALVATVASIALSASVLTGPVAIVTVVVLIGLWDSGPTIVADWPSKILSIVARSKVQNESQIHE